MADFFNFNYAQAESRIHRCGLCEAGSVPREVTHLPAIVLVQVKFPRSKKKRIRKKWAKQKGNYVDRYVTMVLSQKTKAMLESVYGGQNQSKTRPRDADELGWAVPSSH